MSNKELQRQRMMGYFIDAAKQIIKEEGINNLNVRKVGERAGYSYATIYNYFSDLKELLSYCAFEYLEDCYKYIIRFKNDEIDSKQQLIIYASAYIEYFYKNTDIFHLIFIKDLGTSPTKIIQNGKIPSVNTLILETLNQCSKEGLIQKQDVLLLYDIIGSSIHGKLLLTVYGRHNYELENIILSIKNEIEYLIQEKR